MNDQYENIFYFRKIMKIGGTEQFLYEIAKKYHHLDITVFYDDGDTEQIKRLRKLVRCVRRRKGEKIKCNRAFFNFNIDMIDDVDANDYYFISHAIYQELGYKPPIEHPKLNHFIGVSQYSADKLNEYARIIGRDIKAECCYNPLTIEPAKKVIRLISATRLEDRTKGGDRTLKLIDALDRYAKEHDRQYLWLIFTNSVTKTVKSPNICIMQGRTDIRPYIAESDYLVQLSNDMETYCYSINEALSYGVRCVTTPLTVFNELPITEDMILKCDWDMSNVNEVAEHIFEDHLSKFSYKAPEDNWKELLSSKESTYSFNNSKIKLRATDQYETRNIVDKELGFIPKKGHEWAVDFERWEELDDFSRRTGIKLVEVLDDRK